MVKQTPLNVDIIRADFPILQQEHHAGVPLVYLDSTATSQKPRQVIDTITDYYTRYNANVHRGIYALSEAATAAYEDARKKVRRFINAANKREVIFTRGTTESINLVAQTWGRANLSAGDTVLSTVMEHHSNIVPWQILSAEKGFDLRFISLTPDGQLDLDSFERLLKANNVKLVTLVHISNVLGTINPVKHIIQRAHEAGALVLIDAAQSAPHLKLDVQDLDADFVVFSGHKMLGPTGIGILYGKRDLLEAMPPWQGGGDMIATVELCGSTWNELPYKFEAGTPSIAEAIALGAAVDYLESVGMDAIHAHEQSITAHALNQLMEIEDLKIYGPLDAEKRGGVVAFTLNGIHAHDLAQSLDAEGIAVRAGHHCAQPAHDWMKATATARASFYLYNTFEEVDKLAAALEKARTVFQR